jgi:chromatin remodeling complex protein RSC6
MRKRSKKNIREEEEQERRKKVMRLVTVRERTLPEIEESVIFKRLLQLEGKVDELLRQRAASVNAITELARSAQRSTSFRATLYNTFSFQGASYHMEPTDGASLHSPPQWTFRCEIQLLSATRASDGVMSAAELESVKLSHLFRRVVVLFGCDGEPSEFDESALDDEPSQVRGEDEGQESRSDGGVLADADAAPFFVNWRPNSDDDDFNGIEVKRAGSKPLRVRVRLYPKYVVDQWLVDDELRALIGIEQDSRFNIVWKVWQYIKERQLRVAAVVDNARDGHEKDDNDNVVDDDNDVEDNNNDDDDDDTSRRRRQTSHFQVHLDDGLSRLFGNRESIDFGDLQTLVGQHLSPVPPVELDYTLALSGDAVQNATSYCVSCPLSPVAESAYNAALSKHAKPTHHLEKMDAQLTESVGQTDAQLANVLRALDLQRQRVQMLSAFVQDPCQFMHDFVDSQVRDYRLVDANQVGKDLEAYRRTEYFFQPQFFDAITHYLDSK